MGKPSKEKLQWAAGLFIGEGCVTHTIHRGVGKYRYVSVQITMLDERAVEKFASIFGFSTYKVKYRDRHAYRCLVVHTKALYFLNLTMTYMKGTDKFDQAVRVL